VPGRPRRWKYWRFSPRFCSLSRFRSLPLEVGIAAETRIAFPHRGVFHLVVVHTCFRRQNLQALDSAAVRRSNLFSRKSDLFDGEMLVVYGANSQMSIYTGTPIKVKSAQSIWVPDPADLSALRGSPAHAAGS
jgi:hypothetical protein